MRELQIYLVHFLGYLVMAIWALAVYESFPYLASLIGLTDPDTMRFDGARSAWFLFCFFVAYMVIAPEFSHLIVKINELQVKEDQDQQ